MATKKAAKKRMKPKKHTKTAKTVMKKTATRRATATPTLTITLVDENNFYTNQGAIDPPHLSRDPNGGFASHLQFDAQTEVWLCFSANYVDVLQQPVSQHTHLKAGDQSSKYKVKENAPLGAIAFAYSTNGPCAPPAPGGGGDSIIIDT